MTRARSIPLACLLTSAAGCFVDKGDTGAEPSTGATDPSTSATNGHSTTTEPTMADPTTTGTATEAVPGTSTHSTGATDPTDPASGGMAFCQESCRVNADCTVSGMDLGYACEDGRCASTGCTDDDSCRAMFSGWVTECTDQAGCPGQVCVDIGGGTGRCATSPTDFMTCEQIMQVEVVLPMLGGGIDAIVCANVDYVCKDSICVNPCENNASCAVIAGHPTCNIGTGACECNSDDDCKASNVKAFAACMDGVCGCVSDADCTEMSNADVCTSEGLCGCSSVLVCKDQAFDGTTPVCEAP